MYLEKLNHVATHNGAREQHAKMLFCSRVELWHAVSYICGVMPHTTRVQRLRIADGSANTVNDIIVGHHQVGILHAHLPFVFLCAPCQTYGSKGYQVNVVSTMPCKGHTA